MQQPTKSEIDAAERFVTASMEIFGQRLSPEEARQVAVKVAKAVSLPAIRKGEA